MLSTQDASASIMLYNLTAGAVTSYTSGGAVCVYVNEGDEVSVPVASLGTDAVNSVTFRLTEAKADSTEPLTLALGTTELTVKSGSCVTFISACANEITVDASGVTVTKNGEEITQGSFTTELGDVIVIENTSDGGADIIITAALITDGETGED